MSSRTRLFVGNIPEDSNENDLKTAFSSFGDIVNFDLKCKPSEDANKKKFAFVTLSATSYAVESCIRHFSSEDYLGNRLYVARARESFLERLQREREQAKQKEDEKNQTDDLPKKHPTLKLGDKLNPRKRKVDHHNHLNDIKEHKEKNSVYKGELPAGDCIKEKTQISEVLKKKQDADKKRLESIQKKRQEFKQKQMIIKTGLVGVDKTQNKKIIFSDIEDDTPKQKLDNNIHNNNRKVIHNRKNTAVLFEDDDSEEDVNFEIKKQFEGKKGQKVLDLQSRYKSDKRFVLDERFIDDEQSEDDKDKEQGIDDNENIEIGQTDEKDKQMSILQDVLGVTIKSHNNDAMNKKTKSKMGMLRFDPAHPEHAKFLAPIEEKKETEKKSKKKKSKEKLEEDNKQDTQDHPEPPKIEVSKEQFYKVSETLKEAIVQPTSFSLRSLFGNNDEDTKQGDSKQQESGYISLEKPKPSKKMRNPLEPGEKNPFVYDSSDSENEEVEKKVLQEKVSETVVEVKAVWKENLFFSQTDTRFIEGLAFFNKTNEHEDQKERRELKSLMKKRIYNKERKNQMFQKKIGGKKKTMNKNFRRKT